MGERLEPTSGGVYGYIDAAFGPFVGYAADASVIGQCFGVWDRREIRPVNREGPSGHKHSATALASPQSRR
jgi:hypothetical protein